MIKKVLCFVFIFSFSIITLVFAFDTTLLKEEKVNRYVLDNGMIVLLKENHSSPVAAIQILVKTGSSTEGEYEGTGISHFVEHMLFKGTKKRKVGDIPNEIKEAGGMINAYTTYENTGFHTVVASRYFDIGLDVLADSIMNSVFDEDEFNKEKDVILKEINMNEDDPRRSLYLLFWNTAFTSHPYRSPVIGYRSLFSKLTRDDLLKYYREKYIPNNMVLIAVGDFNSKEVLEKIQKIFKDYSRGKLKPVYISQEPRQMGKRERIVEKDINVAHMIMGYHGPDIFSHDIYALDVLSIILGEGRSSRLFKELKEKKQLIYSVRAFSHTPKDPGIIGISFTMEQNNINIVQEECIKEIEKICLEGVTEDEIKKAVTQVESQTIFNQQTVEAQAGNILSDEVVANNINFSKIYLEGISKVTSEDIKKVISKYFTRDNLTIAMIIPRRSNVLDSSAVKAKGEVKSEDKVRKTVLPNGIRVLTRENQELPIITIKAVFQGGVRYENEKNNGISNFAQTIVKKGTKTYSAEAINDTIESIGGSLEAYNGDNSFGFTLNVLKRDFDKGLKLLSSVIFEPTFPQEEIDKERKNILMAIRTREDNVFGSATRLFKKNMFTKHPYGFSGMGEEDTIKSITRDDILNFYNSLCTFDNMVIAVYGDINSDEVIQKISESVSTFKTEQKKAKEVSPEPALQNIKKVEKEKDNITQAIIFMGFQSVDIKNEDRFVFEIITGICSDMGGRLYTKIREEEGLAYFVGSYSILGIDPGAYVFYVGTVQEKTDATVKKILKEIKSLQNKKIPADEISRVKKNLIGEKAIAMQTNESQAFSDALNELYGLGYDYEYQYAEKINKITAEDIQRVAKKYLNMDNYVQVILKPKKK